MGTWSLEYNGQAATFATWRLKAPKMQFTPQGRDEVFLSAEGAGFDSAALFPYGATVKIFLDGVQWFVGRRIQIPRSGTGTYEGVDYLLVGPWYYLERTTLQQLWFGTTWTSHLILNLTPNGFLSPIRDVITAVLNYCLEQNPGVFKIGNVLPDVEELVHPAPDELRDGMCSDVIIHQLRWLLGTGVTWFDYSTTPPTFHCRMFSRLPEVKLNIKSGNQIDRLKIIDRPDLQRPSVKITYEVKSTTNGKERNDVFEDIYPPGATGRELDALVVTLDMQGTSKTTVRASIEVEPIDAKHANEATRLAWWKKYVHDLGQDEVKDLKIPFDSVTRQRPDLLNRIVRGVVAPWMRASDGSPGIGARDVIRCQAEYQRLDGEHVVLGTPGSSQFSECSVTNMKSGTYETTTSFQEGDPIPANLAQVLYNILAVLQFEGEIALTHEELPNPASPNVPWLGKRLSLIGSLPEHATMKAIIQGVTVDAEAGSVVYTLGLPEHLGASDLVQLLKVSRPRRRWTSAASQATGELVGNTVEMGSDMANDRQVKADVKHDIFAVKSGSDVLSMTARTNSQNLPALRIDFGDSKTVIISKGTQEWLSAPKDSRALEIRKVKVCVTKNDGTQELQSMLVIGGLPWKE